MASSDESKLGRMIEPAKNLMVESGASWVLWLLLALSVASLAVALDRVRAFWAEREDIGSLARELHRLLSRRELDPARRRLSDSRSAAAYVVLAGLARWDRGSGAVKEAMAAASGLERTRLERRLLVLGTIGNNAPFVGLLGTVIGIVGAFDELGRVGVTGAGSELAPGRVMASIAEALVATAVGLVVAIPAVALFNYFQGRLSAALHSADTLGHVLLTHVDGGTDAASGDEETR
jgi:biopolymer transport protein ExbB